MMCLTEKTCVWDELHRGMGCSAAGSEVSVSESTIPVTQRALNRNAHKTRNVLLY